MATFLPSDEETPDDGVVAEINITPLTDVFLVLLVIFMVTSSVVANQGKNIDLPGAEVSDTTPQGVTVEVTPDGEIAVNATPVPPARLFEALESALAESREKIVILRGDRKVLLGEAVNILDLAQQAGAKGIALATRPPADPSERGFAALDGTCSPGRVILTGAMAADAVATRRWLFGPVPDLLLGCGLLYALFFAAVLAYGDSRTLMPAFLAPLLVLLFSTPHYGATILRVYEQRSERRRYAVFSVWATLGIAAWFVVGQHWAIAGSLLLTVYLTWSPWHYTGQNYGIAVMLLGRRGVSLDAGTKRWLHWAFIASYLLFFGVIHESAGWAASRALPLDAAGIRFLPLGTPRLLTHAAAAAWILAHGVALVRLLARAPLRDLGPALLLVVSQTLWFALPGVALHWELFGGHEPLGADVQIYFLFWIAVAHAVQYLWITAYYARATRGWNGALPFLARSFAAGAAVWTLPAILFAPVWFGGIGYEAGLALLIGSAVNIHHFVLDGAIWKLRDGPIARVLIRSEAGAEPALAPAARPWPRRTAWAVAVACGALAAFVFTAEFFLVPHALATQDRGRATALLDALDWLGRDSSTQRGRLAGLSLRAGDPEEAARQFERSVALLPTLEGYGALIETLGKLGRIEEAAAHCEALLALAPRDPRALRLAAAVYQRVGRGEEGRALLARAEAVPAPEVAEAAAAGQRPAIY